MICLFFLATTSARPPNRITTPQPLDERPIDQRPTEAFLQPENERPTPVPVPSPTGTVDVHIIPPTVESRVGTYSCRHEGRLYQDKERWSVGLCTNCTCSQGKVDCITNDECIRGLRPTRQPQEEYSGAPIPGGLA